MKQQLRNRIVTFRLTDQEYDSLKAACGTDRSTISVIARRTLLSWVNSQLSRPHVDQRLAEIDSRLEAISKLLTTVKPDTRQ